MKSKKRILLQFQNLTYLYNGLAAVLTKYSINDIEIDFCVIELGTNPEYLEYINKNKIFRHLFVLDNEFDSKIHKIHKIKETVLGKIYFELYLKKYSRKFIVKYFNNTKYSDVFYSWGVFSIDYLGIAYPKANFVMYGDGSGLICNHNARLMDFYNNYSIKLLKLKNPDEIISLAPFKLENSCNTKNVPVKASNAKILLNIIKQDESVQNAANEFADYVRNECIGYDKKILLLAAKLEHSRYRMSESDQIDIYVDMVKKYATKDSLVIIKRHPGTKDPVSALQQKCACKIATIPDKLAPLPIESFSNLLNEIDCVISFISTSKVSLKILYDIEAVDAFDVVQKYHVKGYVNPYLKAFKEICERLPTWDKKSIIYETDIMPDLAEFYRTTDAPHKEDVSPEVENLRKQITDLKNSTSWKVGRAITWMPRKTKAVFRLVRQGGIKTVIKALRKKVLSEIFR